jgi:ATP-dependent DNA helicase Rep
MSESESALHRELIARPRDTTGGLNQAQAQAVRYLDGPCLVIAGAGSGKTRVITQKIAHLVSSGVSAKTIAAITFTNKAAQEMQTRVAPLLRKVAKEGGQPLVCTFHSLGVRIMRSDGAALGLKRNFSILDSDDASGIIMQSLGSTDRKAARVAMSQISLWKNAMIDPDTAAATAEDSNTHQIARVYRDYAATLNAYQALDFDDLISKPVELFSEHESVLSAWRERLRYMLVDEYQDTNACQYELLKLLAGPRAAFTAVGDDDQSIYGWRGATLANLQRLETEYPNLKVITLAQNYRSTQNILTTANALIAANPKLHEKNLFSELGRGDPVRVIACDSDDAEAETVVMRIQAMRFERNAKFSDFAVLYRGNHQARVLEKALRNESVPYEVSGGQSFFDRAEIRDLIAYMRLLANEDDDPALIRAMTTPKRGIGNTTLANLGSYAGERHTSMFEAMFETGFESRVGPRQLQAVREFGDFINRIQERATREPAGLVLDELITGIDYHHHLYSTNDDKIAAVRWQNVSDFVDWLKRRAADQDELGKPLTLVQLSQQIALISQLDGQEKNPDAVRLSTVHAAKGLEYPHVFIVGCEEGLLPFLDRKEVQAASEAETAASDSQGSDSSGADSSDAASARIEEERRLMYVAITRAQRSLHVTWCKARKRARNFIAPKPSRFIGEMQLQALPASTTTVTGKAARGRLGALKDLLNQENT